MARKKSNTKLVAISGLSVVTIVALSIVFVFPNIIPQILGDDLIITTQEEIIEKGIEEGLLTIPTPCFDVTECQEGQPIISEEIPVNPIEEIIDPTPTIEDPIEPEIICEQPNELVDGQCIEPEPEIIIEPPNVEIISNVTKIDNNNERYVSSTSIALPLASLFVEDTSNIDFDQGFIENQLSLKTDPNSNIELTGSFDVMINGTSILSQPIQINVDGVSDQNGLIPINFLSPTGIPSDTFLFQFADHINKFNARGLTQIDFTLTTVTAKINEFDYSLETNSIFEMTIFRDQNLITITDEEGGKVRVFPTDDRVRLCSSAGKYTSQTCAVRSNCCGCQRHRTTTVNIGAQAVGAWIFTQIDKDTGNEILLDSGSEFTGVCALDMMVQRDEVYRLKVSNPEAVDVTFKTPIEQKNFFFNCVRSVDASTATYSNACNYETQAFLDSLEKP